MKKSVSIMKQEAEAYAMRSAFGYATHKHAQKDYLSEKLAKALRTIIAAINGLKSAKSEIEKTELRKELNNAKHLRDKALFALRELKEEENNG